MESVHPKAMMLSAHLVFKGASLLALASCTVVCRISIGC